MTTLLNDKMLVKSAEHQEAELTTQQKILAAAEREFLENGFAGARTTSIAEAAGVTHAMLHYYFHTKGKLFEKVMEDKLSLMGKMMLDSIDTSEKSFFENVEKIVATHYDFIAAYPSLPRFIINEAFSDPDKMKFMTDKLNIHAQSVLSTLQKQIDVAVGRGECKPVKAEMLMLDIISLNIFPFMAYPLLSSILGENTEIISEKRKNENIKTILAKLKP